MFPYTLLKNCRASGSIRPLAEILYFEIKEIIEDFVRCLDMININMQNKTKALTGQAVTYWFENKGIGLERTLFHKVSIPLEKFDSGLEYVSQPEETSIEFDWYNLGLENPFELDGLDLSSSNYPDSETSVYIGGTHNWCFVKKLVFRLIDTNRYNVDGILTVEFEEEGVGLNEDFHFNVDVVMSKET